MITNQSPWRMTHGAINDHLIRLENNNGIKALFKQPRDNGAYKLVEITNEIIVYELALRLGIPVSQTYTEYLENKIGLISIIISELNWSHIIAQGLQKKVENIDLFKQLFVFDVWIANSDRSTGKSEHVIVVPTNNGFSYYAIDHGHTLNGCTQGEIKWQRENVTDNNRFPLFNINHLAEPEIKSFDDLEIMIKKIEGLQDGTIDNIVDSSCLLVSHGRTVEEQAALATNCEIIKALLKHRRDNLRTWMREWCIAKGKSIVVLNN